MLSQAGGQPMHQHPPVLSPAGQLVPSWPPNHSWLSLGFIRFRACAEYLAQQSLLFPWVIFFLTAQATGNLTTHHPPPPFLSRPSLILIGEFAGDSSPPLSTLANRISFRLLAHRPQPASTARCHQPWMLAKSKILTHRPASSTTLATVT